MSKQRQLEQQNRIKQEIINTAKQIVSEEGIDNLSIRKIGKKMDYSPSIIYHYFKDKEEIMDILLSQGYTRIIKYIRSVDITEQQADLALQSMLGAHIDASLKYPDEYKAFLLSENEKTKAKTIILQEGISRVSPTMKAVCDVISKGIEQNVFASCNVEHTAQIIWTSTFGLIIKIILENNLSDEHIEKLKMQHINMLMKAIKN